MESPLQVHLQMLLKAPHRKLVTTSSRQLSMYARLERVKRYVHISLMSEGLVSKFKNFLIGLFKIKSFSMLCRACREIYGGKLNHSQINCTLQLLVIAVFYCTKFTVLPCNKKWLPTANSRSHVLKTLDTAAQKTIQSGFLSLK